MLTEEDAFQTPGKALINRGSLASSKASIRLGLLMQSRMDAQKSMRKLLSVTIVCFLFMLIEIVGGLLSNSIAIMTDAAHMLSDVAGFLMSYFAVRSGLKSPTYAMSFGYHRAEILGAIASIFVIWSLLVWLVIEAIHRLVTYKEINADIMLFTAILGFLLNFVNITLLQYCAGEYEQFMKEQEGVDEDENNLTCQYENTDELDSPDDPSGAQNPEVQAQLAKDEADSEAQTSSPNSSSPSPPP